jgi:Electron transfer DM13
MKTIFLKWMMACMVLTMIASCSKEKIPATLNESSPVNGGTIIRSAGFLSDQRSTGGIVRYVINNGKRYLVFENFSTGADNGLRVYLSKNVSNDEIQDLGRLKAFKGNFSYELQGGFDPLTYNTVLIWQFAFADLYGHATLN